jgi:hypothetical protein
VVVRAIAVDLSLLASVRVGRVDRGKSALHRAECRVTPGRGNPADRATETYRFEQSEGLHAGKPAARSERSEE